LLVVFVFCIGAVSNSISAVEFSQEKRQKEERIYHVDLIPSGKGSLQQVTLTEDIYLHSVDRELNDLWIFDSLGEKLPFEITTPEMKILQLEKEIVTYPIRKPRYLLKQTDNISFIYDQENRISEIQKVNDKASREKEQKVIGYLLDLGEESTNNNISVSFKLSKVAQTSFLRFNIDQSSNLKHWDSVSSNEVLAQLIDNEQLTIHNQIKLSRINGRYLRINLLDKSPAFSIQSSKIEYSEQQNISLVWGQEKQIDFSEIEKAFVINTSLSLAYRTLQLDLPESTSMLRGKLFVKNSEKSVWRLKHHLDFFHIIDGEKHIVKNTVHLNGLRAKKIKLVFDNLSKSQKPDPIKLKLAWMPQKLTFVTNGNTPYEITVGGAKRKPSVQYVENAQNQKMINVIKNEITTPISEAKLGKSYIQLIEPTAESYFNWKKIGLWLVLVVGVVVMAWMAKGLLKQVD